MWCRKLSKFIASYRSIPFDFFHPSTGQATFIVEENQQIIYLAPNYKHINS